jgi:hypothetical protein
MTYCAPPRSRATDPIGSHEAADRVTADGSADAQAAVVLGLVQRHPGRTSRELARLAQMDRHIVARRLPELRDNKLVKNGERRRCECSGVTALTWWSA